MTIEWRHKGFGTHTADVLGARVLVRMVWRGRTPVAYVASVGSWISRDVPFGADRRAALEEAKDLGVRHLTDWGPPP